MKYLKSFESYKIEYPLSPKDKEKYIGINKKLEKTIPEEFSNMITEFRNTGELQKKKLRSNDVYVYNDRINKTPTSTDKKNIFINLDHLNDVPSVILMGKQSELVDAYYAYLHETSHLNDTEDIIMPEQGWDKYINSPQEKRAIELSMKWLNSGFETNEKNIGEYELTDKRYNEIIGDIMYGKDEEDVDKYLNVLDTYQKKGGIIQRIIFSNNKPNLKKIGHSWTHQLNHWKNYIQSLIDFNYEEGKIKGNEDVYMITGETPPNNISIEGSLEQYENNPEEQELTIDDPNKIKILSVERFKTLNI